MKNKLNKILSNRVFFLLILLVIVMIVMSIISPYFLNVNTLITMARFGAVLALVGLGQSLVIPGGWRWNRSFGWFHDQPGGGVVWFHGKCRDECLVRCSPDSTDWGRSGFCKWRYRSVMGTSSIDWDAGNDVCLQRTGFGHD